MPRLALSGLIDCPCHRLVVHFPHTLHATLYRSPQFGNRDICSQGRVNECRGGRDKTEELVQLGCPLLCFMLALVLDGKVCPMSHAPPWPFRAHLGYSRDRSKRTSPLLELQPFTPHCPCDATSKAGNTPGARFTWLSKRSSTVAELGSRRARLAATPISLPD
ncbi:hypothetical protein BKA58DRAFT_179144 [Alternaria rosae]|uniref:uncharacterized protein n=1 Tax=Alternaria rosae TaxID=1187941 RepID=UPI001E8E8DD8|nr:uncharacterized protein BKA58DRAFT_179144 [Alternaria rosae]KAH6870539.1 hypothetical protein BKA58DRAFT_179144 [Alternaria rosae]